MAIHLGFSSYFRPSSKVIPVFLIVDSLIQIVICQISNSSVSERVKLVTRVYTTWFRGITILMM